MPSLLLPMAACVASVLACSALSAETGAVAAARLIAPAAVPDADSDLRFGTFAGGTEGQSITIHPDGGRTVRGGLPIALHHAPGFGPTGFRVAGGSEPSYSISLPREAVLIADSGSSQPALLRFTDFQISPARVGVVGGGEHGLRLGATVTTIGGRAPDSFSGILPVTLSYE